MKHCHSQGVAWIMACGLLWGYACQTPGPKKDIPVAPGTDSSWALLGFEKLDSVNPILIPAGGQFIDPIRQKQVLWEEKDVFNPAIVVRNDTLYMLYRAQDKIGLPGGTSRIGLAYSTDAVHFTRLPTPVLYPNKDVFQQYEWEGGCEDPRVVEDSAGVYYMTYTAYDGKTARLMVAVSKDLLHWIKQGPAFATAYQGRYVNAWSKSGSIVSRYENGKIIATKVQGKYWMYWGDVFIYTAVSDDLVHWSPVEMADDEQPSAPLKGEAKRMPRLKIVVPTREGKFDSDLVESGPPAMLTNKGILLIYNSRNIPAIGDTSLPEGTYAAGQVLLDKDNPLKLNKRMSDHFMHPDKPYEINGQVHRVCFLEGLAQFHNQWFLYYGTADSKIAVARSAWR